MPAPPSPSAIILAAGYSSRMGEFKPLLELSGLAAIDRVIGLYQAVGVTDIHVVTGFRSATIEAAVRSRSVDLVHNPDHDKGMFSSVLAGVNALPEATPAFFVHPVDIPLVRAHTLSVLLETGRIHSPAIAYPTFDDRRGHPPLIRGDLKEAILAHDGEGGLRTLLDRFGDQARDIPVADNGVLLDMDTPDDYALLSNRSETSAILTDDECRQLMEKVVRLPASIIDHCRQVARVAVRLAQAVNTAGAGLDMSRIRSAALVHDVARLEKNHAAAGARLLEQMGFPGLAEIVAVHMQIHVDKHSPIDEAQVVHLADKLVSGSNVVSLAKRFDAKLNKYGHDPIVAEKIEQRRQAALTIQTKIERAAAATIDQIIVSKGSR
jgi:CTP:molybdopterin cytidylyltransferase MocA/HD superfamily phosphodiesterase